MLSQKIAQMESVQRLKTAAQERLSLELQNKEQIENEMDFADNSDEKQGLEYRLTSILSTIGEIKNEIKQEMEVDEEFGKMTKKQTQAYTGMDDKEQKALYKKMKKDGN
ncbi:MAG: hypothetical protein VXY27_05255, partial [Thermoproteota archaeon]|nr:hypothetical protein [Thermoproteota archaeon]